MIILCNNILHSPRSTQCLHQKDWGGTWGCGWQEYGLYSLPYFKNWFEVVYPQQFLRQFRISSLKLVSIIVLP